MSDAGAASLSETVRCRLWSPECRFQRGGSMSKMRRVEGVPKMGAFELLETLWARIGEPRGLMPDGAESYV